jgi:hypothetical protein
VVDWTGLNYFSRSEMDLAHLAANINGSHPRRDAARTALLPMARILQPFRIGERINLFKQMETRSEFSCTGDQRDE